MTFAYTSRNVNETHGVLLDFRNAVVTAMMDCPNTSVSLDGLVTKALDYLDPDCPCVCMDLSKAMLIANLALATIVDIANGAAPLMRHTPCHIDGIMSATVSGSHGQRIIGLDGTVYSS